MDSFKDFRAWLIVAMFTIIVSIGGYVFAAQQEKLTAHGERIARLEAIAESQRDINRELKEIVRYLSTRP